MYTQTSQRNVREMTDNCTVSFPSNIFFVCLGKKDECHSPAVIGPIKNSCVMSASQICFVGRLMLFFCSPTSLPFTTLWAGFLWIFSSQWLEVEHWGP